MSQLETTGMVCSHMIHMWFFFDCNIASDPYHQDLYYQHCNYLPLLNNGTNPGKHAV